MLHFVLPADGINPTKVDEFFQPQNAESSSWGTDKCQILSDGRCAGSPISGPRSTCPPEHRHCSQVLDPGGRRCMGAYSRTMMSRDAREARTSSKLVLTCFMFPAAQ